MNYKLLNNDQRKRMKRIINNENEIQAELVILKRILSQYDVFLEDKEIFIKNIKK